METDHLILAPISADDHSFMAEFLSDPMLTRYFPKGGPYTGPEIEAYMAARLAHWEAHGFGMLSDSAFDCYGNVVFPFSITLDQFRDKPLLHTKGA